MSRPPQSVAIDGPVLVVAPHPDDETLGCGGLIAEAVGQGFAVHTVFVTDGAASHPGSLQWSRAKLARRREREAREALRRLGAGEQPRTFLRLPDSGMPDPSDMRHAQAVTRMAGIVRDLSPRLAVLPWRRDPHRDHRGSWRLAMDAIDETGLSPCILEYAVWLDDLGVADDHPRPGEMEPVGLDIGAHAQSKQQAVQAHLSQLGSLITDDPSGFTLPPEMIARLTGRWEAYWRPCGAR
ncbi:PIG-L family deacetylase [Glycocaulis profundi]|nr:PIG-L family deacetylase [Glycocaulis profundi]